MEGVCQDGSQKNSVAYQGLILGVAKSVSKRLLKMTLRWIKMQYVALETDILWILKVFFNNQQGELVNTY